MEMTYVNNTTGEATTNRDIATAWYRDGDEVGLHSWSDTLQEWVERATWVH